MLKWSLNEATKRTLGFNMFFGGGYLPWCLTQLNKHQWQLSLVTNDQYVFGDYDTIGLAKALANDVEKQINTTIEVE